MKTLTYDHRREERESWGEGPWIDEPDKMQWLDEDTGLPCLAVRSPLGAWCGYVGVSEGHPLFHKSYTEIYGDSIYDDDDNYVGEGEPLADIRVHGGLTFGGFCVEDGKEHGICHVVEPGENDRVFWHGFDCSHAGDLSPGLLASDRKAGIERSMNESLFGEPDEYRTIEYAHAMTTSLARQLAAAS